MPEAAEARFQRPDASFNDLPGWSWVGTYGGYFLQADLLRNFEHGFFCRLWQGRGPDELAGFLSAGVSVHRLRQVHGGVVLSASEARGEPWPEADGLSSDTGVQSLWVCGADCTPVLIADPRNGRVAACHAGWRGVAARIVPTAIKRMEAAGSCRSELRIALGPAIAGPAYQVERSVTEAVARSLQPLNQPDPAESLQALAAAGALLPDATAGRDRLDIRAATALQLELFGIDPERLAWCPLCTLSEQNIFHSWRRDQVRAVQWSGIVSQA
jgi:YfiH family protein